MHLMQKKNGKAQMREMAEKKVNLYKLFSCLY